MGYYKKMLESVGGQGEYPMTIVVNNDGKKTKTLDLNEESIPEVIAWLEDLQTQISESSSSKLSLSDFASGKKRMKKKGNKKTKRKIQKRKELKLSDTKVFSKIGVKAINQRNRKARK